MLDRGGGGGKVCEISRMRERHRLKYLCFLYIVIQLTTLMLVWTGEFLCWLFFFLRPLIRCRLSWSLNLVTHSGGRNLTYIIMVAIRNIRAE